MRIVPDDAELIPTTAPPLEVGYPEKRSTPEIPPIKFDVRFPMFALPALTLIPQSMPSALEALFEVVSVIAEIVFPCTEVALVVPTLRFMPVYLMEAVLESEVSPVPEAEAYPMILFVTIALPLVIWIP
jgi:hypothetical protein